MKKKTSAKTVSATDDEMRPEYDFSGGARGKYAKALREKGYTIRVYHADGAITETQVLGEKTVVLEPDVLEYFPTSEAVNRALRALIALVPEKRKTASKSARTRERKTAARKRLKL
jgi:hypothetical protein